ncbi:hypothetical protein C8R47DRAFT_1090496 [Mycena vitilis]|nr:hypothetical protein C8R47DRAFT_1090496 [Mycena vitilis]
MCLHKISHPDGASDCPCPRYIPQDNAQSGPRLCRDCEHWESLHPLTDAPAPKATGIADLMARLKPQVEKARQSGASLDDEARRESNAGFKKVSEESKGRGGATKYQKKKPGPSKKPAGKTHTVGEVVLIPDAYFADADTADEADDVKDMGVAPVPSVNKHQSLKEGSLVVSHGVDGRYLEYSEGWSAEHIDTAFLEPLFPAVWEYMRKTHDALEAGEFYWVPLWADHGRLKVFVKKDPIIGSDLHTIRAGKGKRVDQSTLYFALRFNVPNSVWVNDRWDKAPSDSDFSQKKGKGKDKAQPKPLFTRQSTRKAMMKGEDSQSIYDVDAEDSTNNPSKGKTSASTTPIKVKNEPGSAAPQGSVSLEISKSTPVKVKLEPESSKTANKDSLFFEIDSDSDDSDVDFPESLITGPAQASASIANSLAVAPMSSSGPGAVGTSLMAPATGTGTSMSSTGTPYASSAAAANLVGSGLPSNLTPSASRSTHYFGGSASASTSMAAGPSLSSSSSSAPPSVSRPFKRPAVDYAAETAAMESFNEFGNYREPTSERPFDMALFQSSGLRSPERPAYNPWKRPRKSM